MELNKKIGEMEFDGLVSDMNPAIKIAGGTIAGAAAATSMERGTVLAKSTKTGKLSVLGTESASGDTLTPDCILCDPISLEANADATVPVYVTGCFDIGKVKVADGYTITEADKDKLRERGIFFKAALTD